MKKLFDQLTKAATEMAQDLEHTFAGNTQVGLDLAAPTCAPGETLRGTAWVAAGDRDVTVTLYRVHLQAAGPRPSVVVVEHHGAHETQHHHHHGHAGHVMHDVFAPLVLGERFVVPARSRRDASFELAIPPGLPPSAPGAYEYRLRAWAVVQGQMIDSVFDLPLWIAPAGSAAAAGAASRVAATGGAATADAAGVDAPAWLRPGANVIAVAPDGEGTTQVLVVEVRGAVTLVQWPDARPATWVRTDSLRQA